MTDDLRIFGMWYFVFMSSCSVNSSLSWYKKYEIACSVQPEMELIRTYQVDINDGSMPFAR